MLRGDERCKEYAKSSGNDLEIECPPDQPVCRARRAIIPPGKSKATLKRVKDAFNIILNHYLVKCCMKYSVISIII